MRRRTRAHAASKRRSRRCRRPRPSRTSPSWGAGRLGRRCPGWRRPRRTSSGRPLPCSPPGGRVVRRPRWFLKVVQRPPDRVPRTAAALLTRVTSSGTKRTRGAALDEGGRPARGAPAGRPGPGDRRERVTGRASVRTSFCRPDGLRWCATLESPVGPSVCASRSSVTRNRCFEQLRRGSACGPRWAAVAFPYPDGLA
jgi:hypothetical protein